MNPAMPLAAQITLLASGIFFITGLLTGVWKYRCIMSSTDAKAPVYVDICHRAALMYSFACIVLLEFAQRSIWSSTVNIIAVLAPVLYFAFAIASYALHGVLRDTENQLERPHRVGSLTLPGPLLSVFFWSLVAAELGGFLVLFVGGLKSL